MNSSPWPLSKALLFNILDDRIKDVFVCQMVWERLGYQRSLLQRDCWEAGPFTPAEWRSDFPEAPQIIVSRKASVRLTRSIRKEYKQLLKTQLNFPGYRINELYPRKTRRATVVNWLLAWSLEMGEELPLEGPLPLLLSPPTNPLNGHPGDPVLE